MIVFGSAITDSRVYEQYAKAGIRLAAEPDSVVLAYESTGSLFRNYNLLLDKAAEFDDLEALVLMHQDTELVDSDFCDKVREATERPRRRNRRMRRGRSACGASRGGKAP